MTSSRPAAMIALLASASCFACGEQPDGLTERSRPTYSADGSSIVLSLHRSGRPHVYRLTRDGSNAQRIDGDNNGVEPAMSPDGRTMAFVNIRDDESGQIVVGSVDGGPFRSIGAASSTPSMDALPMFLDSERLAFFHSEYLRTTSTFGKKWRNWDLMIADLHSASPPRRVGERFPEVVGAAACAGRGIWVGTYEGIEPETRFVALSGETFPPWLHVTSPAASPDCKMMAAVLNLGTGPTGHYDYEYVLRRSVGEPATQITRLGSYLAGGAIAPDGRSLLFLSDPERDDTFELIELYLESAKVKTIATQLKSR